MCFLLFSSTTHHLNHENHICVHITVPELLGRLHADLQLDLHHVAHRSLVWLSPVFGANVARIPLQLLGGHQRVTGIFSIPQFADFANIFANIFNLICIMSLVAHWSGCIQFLVPMLNGFPHDSWVAINELQVAHERVMKSPLLFPVS